MQRQRRQKSGLHQPDWGLLAGGTALAIYGLSRRTKTGFALATVGGFVALQAALSASTEHSARAQFLVNASREEAYRRWRDVESFPRFMTHIEAVRLLDADRLEWTARGFADSRITWTAIITEDIPNERIAWRSVAGSKVDSRYVVEFRSDPQGRGTMVSARSQYRMPAGPIARGVATLLGRNPQFVLREDLRRFKALLETGETATTRGQSHGPRGLSGRMRDVFFREKANHPLPGAQKDIRSESPDEARLDATA